MSLDFAILGFLTFEPLSGYDLKTRYFDGSVGNFWPADQRQIYRVLDRLESEGWVTHDLIIQEGKPNRKEFTITPAGRNALRNWLKTAQPAAVIRFPFLVQFYFMRGIEADEALPVLRDQLRQHAEQLAIYHDIVLPDPDDPETDYEDLFGALTLNFGMRFEQMRVEWLEAVIALLEERSG